MESDDQAHIEAAEGWLGLGNWNEANQELEKLSPDSRVHSKVLRLRYLVYEKAQKWDYALNIAQLFSKHAPTKPSGWINTAHCLHRLKRTAESRDTLLPVLDKFPEEWIMRYNLACYECQLGNLKGAWDWLEKTFDIKDSPKVKQMALDDKDLEPLWADISQI